MTDSVKSNNSLVAGIVVLYNPDDTVVSNIASYINQIKELVAFDNSDDSNVEIINEIKSLPNIHYYSENRNCGVGYVLNYGAQRAIKNKYHYLFTMDQDSFCNPGMIQGLLEIAEKIENTGIISPIHRNKFKTQENFNNDYDEILSIKTSGNLLNLKIYEQAGPFKEDFFIDYIDIEYGMRLNRLGFKVIRANHFLLNHNEANLSEINFLGKKIYPWNHQPERWYYKIRNLLYLEEQYKNYYPDFFKREKIYYLKQFLKIVLFEKSKFQKLSFAWQGYKAFQSGIKQGRI